MTTVLAVLAGWCVLSPTVAVVAGLVLRQADRCERSRAAERASRPVVALASVTAP